MYNIAMLDTKKWKTEWDLSIYYKNPNDPQIDKDINEVEQKTASFVKKYTKNKAYLENPKALAEMFKDEEKISLLKGLNKPLLYFAYLIDSGKATPDVYKKDALILKELKKRAI